MPADNEPKALVVDVMSEIISYIKQSRPTFQSGDTATTEGFVYSQLRVGQMVAPIDFARAWTPMGGTQVSAAAAAGTTPQPPAASEVAEMRRSYQAAFNTQQLV